MREFATMVYKLRILNWGQCCDLAKAAQMTQEGEIVRSRTAVEDIHGGSETEAQHRFLAWLLSGFNGARQLCLFSSETTS